MEEKRKKETNKNDEQWMISGRHKIYIIKEKGREKERERGIELNKQKRKRSRSKRESLDSDQFRIELPHN